MWIPILLVLPFFIYSVTGSETKGEYLRIEEEEVNLASIIGIDDSPTILSSHMKCARRKDCDTIALENHPSSSKNRHYFVSKKPLVKKENSEKLTAFVLKKIDDQQIFNILPKEKKSAFKVKEDCKNSSCGKNAECMFYNGIYECVCVCGYSRRSSKCERDDLSQLFKLSKLELFQTKCVPRKDNCIGTLQKIGREFRLKLDIYASELSPKWINIFHFMKTDRYDNLPAIWLNEKNALYACLHEADKRDASSKCLNTKFRFGTNRWIKLEVSREKKTGGKYRFIVKIDGMKVFKLSTILETEYFDVKVYVSNLWHMPLFGFYRDLSIEGKKIN